MPASMISTACGRLRRKYCSANGLSRPCPDPMGAPQGMSTEQPASSRRLQLTTSSVQ